MNKEVYLAVNKDGSEVMSQTRLIRYADSMKHILSVREDMRKMMYKDKDEHIWTNTTSDGYFQVPIFVGIILPNGTIEKLTGQSLDWNSEPIKYVG